MPKHAIGAVGRRNEAAAEVGRPLERSSQIDDFGGGSQCFGGEDRVRREFKQGIVRFGAPVEIEHDAQPASASRLADRPHELRKMIVGQKHGDVVHERIGIVRPRWPQALLAPRRQQPLSGGVDEIRTATRSRPAHG